MNPLELSSVTRAYAEGVPVLEDVDLTVGPGEVVGLLGENGAGKTTLIKVALGMLHPQRGEARLFGLDPRERPVEAKRRVGYVSEDQVLPPYLRVSAVLEMHRALYPTWDARLEAELLERFSFSPRQRVSTLSKGQARRVAVLCAVAHRPELLLLDEPAGGFDPAARREFLEIALQHLAAEGAAILFSSHHMQDVERLAGRVCLLQDRRVLLDEDLDELRERTTLAVLPAGNGARVADLRAIEGCVAARAVDDELHGIFLGGREAARRRLAALGHGREPSLAPISLEELFIELVEGRR